MALTNQEIEILRSKHKQIKDFLFTLKNDSSFQEFLSNFNKLEEMKAANNSLILIQKELDYHNKSTVYPVRFE